MGKEEEDLKITCIALDLDGTTLNPQGRLGRRNREAIEKALDAGIQVVAASGRSLDSLPKDILEIEGIQYGITSNGAAVYRLSDRKCLKQSERVCGGPGKLWGYRKGYTLYPEYQGACGRYGKLYPGKPGDAGLSGHCGEK